MIVGKGWRFGEYFIIWICIVVIVGRWEFFLWVLGVVVSVFIGGEWREIFLCLREKYVKIEWGEIRRCWFVRLECCS